MSYIVNTGNLVEPPTMRRSQKGNDYATASVIVNTRRQVDGEWQSVGAQRYDLTVMGHRGRAFVEAVERAGRNIAVVFAGTLAAREYERRDGSKGTSLEVMVDHIGASFAGQTVDVSASRRAEAEPSSTPVTEQAPPPEEEPWPEVTQPGGQW